jgi:sigma-B regulation protein RsbU (phosphoserine phosphatase)
MTLANSGLPYPLLVRDGTPKFLELAGIPVGLFADSSYQEFELDLQPGDVLSFCSDGLIEARNESNDDFGLKRFAEVVRAHCDESSDNIVHAVNEAVDEFAGPVPPHDDRTLIVIKVKS